MSDSSVTETLNQLDLPGFRVLAAYLRAIFGTKNY